MHKLDPALWEKTSQRLAAAETSAEQFGPLCQCDSDAQAATRARN
jgi:hypothetical protein